MADDALNANAMNKGDNTATQPSMRDDEIVYTSLQALVDNKRAVLQHPIYAY